MIDHEYKKNYNGVLKKSNSSLLSSTIGKEKKIVFFLKKTKILINWIKMGSTHRI